MRHIAHIVNPVKVDEDNELYWQQPIVFESLRRASHDSVELWQTGYEEDPEIYGFLDAGRLTNSTLDLNFETPRKLPFFQEILNNLYNGSTADIFIQTNADIGVMPFFYDAIDSMLEHGYDAMVINKRIVPDYYQKVEDLPMIYGEYGGHHNGYDCFVFRKELYPDFDLGETCMGTPWSEAALVANMIAYSDTCHVFKYPHLTFHMGDSRTWMKYHDYRRHNTEQFAKVLKDLMPRVEHSPTIHWLLWKLKKELKKEYSDDCHQVVEHLNVAKLNEYVKGSIV